MTYLQNTSLTNSKKGVEDTKIKVTLEEYW